MKIGYVDVIEEGILKGWAYSQGESERSTILVVTIDNIIVDSVNCSEERNDVFEAGHSRANVGFTYNIPHKYLDGLSHRIRLSFVDNTIVPFIKNGHIIEELAFAIQPSEESVYDGWIDQVRGDVISGWAVRYINENQKYTNGVHVAVFCDDTLIGQTLAADYRPDVGETLKVDAACGFHFKIPHNYLIGQKSFTVKTVPDGWPLHGSPVAVSRTPGLQEVKINFLRAEIGQALSTLWKTQNSLAEMLSISYTSVNNYNIWAKSYYKKIKMERTADPIIDETIFISVLCPVYKPRAKDFIAAIQSVIDQSYRNWELIIVDDKSQSIEITSIISDFCRADSRIKFIEHDQNLGISAATNTAINASSGQYIAFFDHDDLLVDVALEVMLENAIKHSATILYSDEDKVDDLGNFSEPNLKPDWNLRLLLAQNYVCHLLFVKTEVVKKVGPFRSEYDGAQDHDFILRLSELENEIVFHVREILYHWRKTPNSTASTISNKTYAIDAGISAVQNYLDRQSKNGGVTSRGEMTNYIVKWAVNEEPSVSVIIPFKDNAFDTKKCVDSFLANTNYKNYEIVLVNNYSVKNETHSMIADYLNQASNIRAININEEFNYSKINNIAASSCQSDMLLFLNNDVFVTDGEFLTQMVGELSWRDDVGAVGCKLLYPSRRVQHAGVITGIGDGGIAEHPYRGLTESDPGFMGRAVCSQELSAVTAAAILCKKSVFAEVNGFDEVMLKVAFNDVDLCLKIRKAGYRIIWRAETIAIHAESASRLSDMHESKIERFVSEHVAMREKWGESLVKDPFYHPFFDRDALPFEGLKN